MIYKSAGCVGMTSVIIPNSVTSIEEATFNGCSGLNSVTIPSSVTRIEQTAFQKCTGLTSVTIPNSVTRIGGHAFSGCIGLTSITIPNSVTRINDFAFLGCSGLTSLIVESGNTKYDSRENCNAIIETASNTLIFGCNNTTIPNSVTIIDSYAFYGCSGMNSITIPNSVTRIGYNAFKGCENLTSVTIGSGIETIGFSAFASCPELTDVYCYAEKVPSTDSDVFEDSYIEYATLYVLEATIEEYKAKSPWNMFKKIVSIEDMEKTHVLTYVVDGETYKTFKVMEGEAITPEDEPTKEGYTFSGWSEIPTTMPAHDVTVTGSFSVNKYILIYILDGKEYKTMEVEYGTVITPEPDLVKEGYTFSGWSEIPETMPAHIVIITGSFNINSYTLTYMIDEEVYKQVVYEYGAAITPEPQPEGDYVSFEWVGVPETMPAHDVTVTAVYETGIAEIMMMAQQGQLRIYSPNGKLLSKLQKGLNIVVMQDGTTKKVVVK